MKKVYYPLICNHYLFILSYGIVVVSSLENHVSFLTCLTSEELMTFTSYTKQGDIVFTIQIRNCV